MNEYRKNTTFQWRGELIPDIAAWASQRGELMVQYDATRTVPSLTGELVTERQSGEMPETFWDTLRMADGWQYTETGRRTL